MRGVDVHIKFTKDEITHITPATSAILGFFLPRYGKHIMTKDIIDNFNLSIEDSEKILSNLCIRGALHRVSDGVYILKYTSAKTQRHSVIECFGEEYKNHPANNNSVYEPNWAQDVGVEKKMIAEFGESGACDRVRCVFANAGQWFPDGKVVSFRSVFRSSYYKNLINIEMNKNKGVYNHAVKNYDNYLRGKNG